MCLDDSLLPAPTPLLGHYPKSTNSLITHYRMKPLRFTLLRLLATVGLLGTAFGAATWFWLNPPIRIEDWFVVVVGIGTIFGAAIGAPFRRAVPVALMAAILLFVTFLPVLLINHFLPAPP